jgi:hypothetical protein
MKPLSIHTNQFDFIYSLNSFSAGNSSLNICGNTQCTIFYFFLLFLTLLLQVKNPSATKTKVLSILLDANKHKFQIQIKTKIFI